MVNEKIKKNYAFISYSHHDIKIARWLHRKLESYKLPSEIHNEFENSKYLRPIFRDQEDLNTGVLGDELHKNLDNSKYLIVICSPNSVKSKWVSDEVKHFIECGRLEYIIPFIIDGVPNIGREDEIFPSSLSEYIKEHPDKELLGISTSEIGYEKAFIRVVSRMLGVSFDELWKRHERERRRRIITWSIATTIAVTLLYYVAVPISLDIKVVDAHHHLPIPEDAVLVVATTEYPLDFLDTTITINDIPGYCRGRKVPISYSSTYYKSIEDEVNLGMGMNKTKTLMIERDSSFAIYAGTVVDIDGMPIEQVMVQIGDSIMYTNSRGYFKFVFSVADQSECKALRIEKYGKKTIIRDDECPSYDLKYIMYDE